jgi:hypothetical protein
MPVLEDSKSGVCNGETIGTSVNYYFSTIYRFDSFWGGFPRSLSVRCSSFAGFGQCFANP